MGGNLSAIRIEVARCSLVLTHLFSEASVAPRQMFGVICPQQLITSRQSISRCISTSAGVPDNRSAVFIAWTVAISHLFVPVHCQTVVWRAVLKRQRTRTLSTSYLPCFLCKMMWDKVPRVYQQNNVWCGWHYFLHFFFPAAIKIHPTRIHMLMFASKPPQHEKAKAFPLTAVFCLNIA